MDIFYEYLIEANKALDNYTELSEYQSLFEATKSEEIAEIEVNNKKAVEKSESLFKKAINVIRGILDKIRDAITNFFDYLKLSTNEKSAYNKFKNAIKNDPELGNKKVTVKVYQDITKTYDAAIKRAEDAYEAYKKDEAANRPDLMKEIQGDVKKGVKVVTKTVTLNALLHIINDDINAAKLMTTAIKSDNRVLDYLEDQFGEKGAKKIKRVAKSRSSLIGMRRFIATLRRDESKCLIESVQGSLTDAIGLVRSAAKVAPDETKEIIGAGIDVAKIGAGSSIKRKMSEANPITRMKNKRYEKKVNNTLDSIDAMGNSIKKSGDILKSGFSNLGNFTSKESGGDMYPIYNNEDTNYISEVALLDIIALGAVLAGGILLVKNAKIPDKEGKRIEKLFKIYEKMHPDCIPFKKFKRTAYTFDNLPSEIMQAEVHNKYMSEYISNPNYYLKYFLYNYKKYPTMYCVEILAKNGSDMINTNYITSECGKHKKYYDACMCFDRNVYTKTLELFIKDMEKVYESNKRMIKESCNDDIIDIIDTIDKSNTNEDIFKEFKEEAMDFLGDEYYEGANYDVATKFKNAKHECRRKFYLAKKSIRQKKYKESAKYLAEAKDSITELKVCLNETVNNPDSTITEVAIGILFSAMHDFSDDLDFYAVLALESLVNVSKMKYIQNIQRLAFVFVKLVNEIRMFKNSVVQSETITIANFNPYLNRIRAELDKLESLFHKTIDAVVKLDAGISEKKYFELMTPAEKEKYNESNEKILNEIQKIKTESVYDDSMLEETDFDDQFLESLF